MEHMIEIKNISKSYGGKKILSEISFSVGKGRITAFLGPNGAGKSSTLRILFGLDKADSGRATLKGKDYQAFRRPLRVVGVVFDGVGSPGDRTVYQHLRIAAASNGIAKTRIGQVLKITDMEHKKDSSIGTLSLGEGQRLGMAVAILGDPEILVFDEPTNGLDPKGIRWFRDFIREEARRGKTVLLSSHMLSEVQAIADELVIIHKGEIVARGALEEVMKNLSSLEDLFFQLTDGGTWNE